MLSGGMLEELLETMVCRIMVPKDDCILISKFMNMLGCMVRAIKVNDRIKISNQLKLE